MMNITKLTNLKFGQKFFAFLLWIILIGAYWWYAAENNLTPVDAVRKLINIFSNKPFGPIIYILVFAIRPLILFPIAILIFAAGYLYGSVYGIFFALLGGLVSAMCAYLTGRYFGQGLLISDKGNTIMEKYALRLQKNSFDAVLIMRFLLLPHDLVSYTSGLLRINWKSFLLATLLGSIPGTVSYVLFTSSIKGDFTSPQFTLNPWSIGVSVILFIGSMGLSFYFKTMEKIRIK